MLHIYNINTVCIANCFTLPIYLMLFHMEIHGYNYSKYTVT